jgi:hypothetical protein
MNKAAALYTFFNSFKIDGFPATAVPDDVTFPYLTYDLTTSAWGEGEVNCTVNIYYYTESEALPNQKAEELSKAIGLGGMRLLCDEGMIWVKRGTPWCQALTEGEKNEVKRRYININLEYFTL